MHFVHCHSLKRWNLFDCLGQRRRNNSGKHCFGVSLVSTVHVGTEERERDDCSGIEVLAELFLSLKRVGDDLT